MVTPLPITALLVVLLASMLTLLLVGVHTVVYPDLCTTTDVLNFALKDTSLTQPESVCFPETVTLVHMEIILQPNVLLHVLLVPSQIQHPDTVLPSVLMVPGVTTCSVSTSAPQQGPPLPTLHSYAKAPVQTIHMPISDIAIQTARIILIKTTKLTFATQPALLIYGLIQLPIDV